MAVKRSAAGYVEEGDENIASRLISDEKRNVEPSLEKYSDDLALDPAVPVVDPPLDNVRCLVHMKEMGACNEPGHVIYLEFDVSPYSVPELLMLRDITDKFMENIYVFSINVTAQHMIAT